MSIYDEIEIEDMDFRSTERTFYYSCPCGDRFFITLDDLLSGEDIAKCPSCSLQIRVVFDPDALDAFVATADAAGIAAAGASPVAATAAAR